MCLLKSSSLAQRFLSIGAGINDQSSLYIFLHTKAELLTFFHFAFLFLLILFKFFYQAKLFVTCLDSYFSLFFFLSFGFGNSGSTTSLVMSSSIHLRRCFNNSELSSIQGFVFTSISQRLKSLSTMKSYPNNSNVCFQQLGSSFHQVADKLCRIKYFMCGMHSFQKSIQSLT